MRVLFDNNIPRGLARTLKAHTIIEARARNWHLLKNGELLQAAEAAAFDVLVTSDKGIKYQQNLTGRKIALVVLSQGRWKPVRQRLDVIAAAVRRGHAGQLHRSRTSVMSNTRKPSPSRPDADNPEWPRKI